MRRLLICGFAIVFSAVGSAVAQTPDRTPDNFNDVPRTSDLNAVRPDGGPGAIELNAGTGGGSGWNEYPASQGTNPITPVPDTTLTPDIPSPNPDPNVSLTPNVTPVPNATPTR